MIKISSAPGDDILEVRISGLVSAEDYEARLVPALEAALEDPRRLLMDI